MLLYPVPSSIYCIKQGALQAGKDDGEVLRSAKKVRQKRKVGDMIKEADSRGKFTMGK